MRTLTSDPRTGAFTALLSLLIVALFAYANLLCIAGAACEHGDNDSDYAGSDASHHDEAPAHPAKDCAKDSCFCITMNTVVTQPTVIKPNHSVSLRVVDFVLVDFHGGIPALTTTAYEHGPPGIAPPDYLFSKT